jgi:hypothetical protein
MSFVKRDLTDDELNNMLAITNLATFTQKLNVYKTMKNISDDQASDLRDHQRSLAPPVPLSRTRTGGKRRRCGKHRSTRRGGRKSHRGGKRRSCKKY